MRNLNILPRFIFFHIAVFRNIKTNFIHQSHHPLGTEKKQNSRYSVNVLVGGEGVYAVNVINETPGYSL